MLCPMLRIHDGFSSCFFMGRFDFVMKFEPIESCKQIRALDTIGIRKALKVGGAQEDAEEFLSKLLMGLHDEMVKVGPLTSFDLGPPQFNSIPLSVSAFLDNSML